LPFRAQNCRNTAGLATKYTDIAIIGGGLAGSTAAATRGRAGIPTVLIDPHQAYPFDFRVEKNQRRRAARSLLQTGIADSVLRSATQAAKTGSRDSATRSTEAQPPIRHHV
jgi:2-polyprenyl-6-methoxyphenol hydroxylase-like FAD-dependent oxidoreductase